jgi:hypothetical protein
MQQQNYNFWGLSQKGDFKQFTPSTMYYRGGKVANSGLLRQPLKEWGAKFVTVIPSVKLY